jgi:membrane-associated phospholipid phosphatase/protein-tyrosine phosphatase
MDEKRLTLLQKLYALTLCAIVFMMVYNFAAWYASNLTGVPSFVFDFEKHIPFIPWSIIPYMTSGIFFCTVFFFCQNREELKVLIKRMLFATLVAGVFFLLFPLQFSLSKPEVSSSVLGYSFQFLKIFDSPFNQAPSLHIAYAFIFWSVFRNIKRGRTFLMLWLILLGISTLTTYQHHFIDIITGGILAHLSFIIFPYRKNDFLYRNFHVANIYFLSGWILILTALLMNQFVGKALLLLLWPGFMILLIGYHYQKNDIFFLKNKEGNIPWFKKLFYGPYLLLYTFFWRFLRENRTPLEVIPRLYISSRPDHESLKNFELSQKTIVYDLSAEMEELTIIKNTTAYHTIPFLDIGILDIHETQKLVSEITEKHKQLPADGKILIHCTMGFTRSSVIGILVIKNILSLPLTEAITIMKTHNKHAVIPTYLEDFLKKF